MKIAFVGLGHMGEPMARNLLHAGHSLTVFDLSKRSMDTLTAAGAAPAASAKQAAAQADVVLTMLPSSPHVKTVYLGPDGVLAGVRGDVPLIDRAPLIRTRRVKSRRSATTCCLESA